MYQHIGVCTYIALLFVSFLSIQETITEMGTLSWLSMKALVWVLGDYEQYKRSKTVIRKFIGKVSPSTRTSTYLYMYVIHNISACVQFTNISICMYIKRCALI